MAGRLIEGLPQNERILWLSCNHLRFGKFLGNDRAIRFR